MTIASTNNFRSFSSVNISDEYLDPKVGLFGDYSQSQKWNQLTDIMKCPGSKGYLRQLSKVATFS